MECEICENDVPTVVGFDGVDRCFKCDSERIKKEKYNGYKTRNIR